MSSVGSTFIREKIEQSQVYDNTLKNNIMLNSSTTKITNFGEDENKKITNKIKDHITQVFGEKLITNISDAGFMDQVKRTIEADLLEYNLTDIIKKHNLIKSILDDIFGFGPIQDALNDKSITEIMVCRYDKVYVEKNGRLQFCPEISFANEQQLLDIIQKIVNPLGRQVNESSPIVDARLPDGSRVNATIKPVAVDGATLTIRKFSDKKLTGEDYLKFGSLNENELQFLIACVQARVNLFVSGGTGSGKTTLLNMLSNYIPSHEAIITIEDSCELKLAQDNVRRFESKPKTAEGMGEITIRQLVKNALRQRPDRIVVGEIRDGVIVDFMRAAGSGHDGSMSTGHANSPRQLIDSAFPILFGMSDMTFTESSQKQQICSSLDLIVQISRLRDGSRKITSITEVTGYGKEAAKKLNIPKSEAEANKIYLKDIFRYNDREKKHESTGYIPQDIVEKMMSLGVPVNLSIFQKE